MTLKHKNRSKWAQRILKRGLAIQDEGTQAAISEQLHQHALLTRKMNSIEDNSDDDISTDDNDNDDSDELLSEKGKQNVSKLLNKAKESTLKALEDASELPKSGVFALPFMVWIIFFSYMLVGCLFRVCLHRHSIYEYICCHWLCALFVVVYQFLKYKY